MPVKAILIRSGFGQRMLGKVQQALHAVIKLHKAWPLKQACQIIAQPKLFSGAGQVHDQHMILATAGERVRLPARHNAGMQTIHRAALTLHLEICAAAQPDNQLVLGMGVNRGLYRKIQ